MCKMGHVEGGGFNNNGNNYNMREVDINQPAFGEEEMEFPMGSIEEEIEEGRETQRPKKLRLTKEQARLLEESFRQNHTLNPVCILAILSFNISKSILFVRLKIKINLCIFKICYLCH